MPTVSKVTAAVPATSGAVYVAPSGTSVPTSASASLSAFTELGYISSDGMTNSNSNSTNTVEDWGGTPVLVVEESKTDTFKMKFIEALNADVAKLVYGDDNVTGSGTTFSIKSNSTPAVEKVIVIDMIMRNNTAKRIVIPKGYVTALGDISYKKNDAVGYELTITAMPDSQGNTHYEYIAAAST